MIIYKAVNKINGKMYIGQTINKLQRRLRNHLNCEKTAFSNALKKYGLSSFNLLIIENCNSREELNEREMYWIKYYDCISPKGYNLTSGGNGPVISEETKKKIGLANTGRKHSEETKKEFSRTRKGIRLSREHKEKIREARKYQIITESKKLQMSESAKRQWQNPSFREMMVTNAKSRTVSDETKQKYRESKLGKLQSEKTKNKISKSLKLYWEKRKAGLLEINN